MVACGVGLSVRSFDGDSDDADDVDAAQINGDVVSDDSESDPDDYPVAFNPTWQPNCAMGMREIPFTRQNRMLVPLPGENRPYDWFTMLFDDILVENIVKHTNKYAWDVFGSPNLTPGSRIYKWRDVTADEIKDFVGLLIDMGTVRVNRFNGYWNTSTVDISTLGL